jgi:predicted RNA-binding Zn-ribbon protein involved in translation (DUF1610 family)
MTTCLHERAYRKYVLGMQDDFVCPACGETFANRRELESAQEEAKKQLEQK